jgi:hypothetical protein
MKVWALFTVDPDGDQLVSLNQTLDGAQRRALKEAEPILKGRGLFWMPEEGGSHGSGYYATSEGMGMLYTLEVVEVGE